MTRHGMEAVVAECHYPDYFFGVFEDTRGTFYLQGTYQEPDVETGEPALQFTRRWLLSPEMTVSEIVQTVLKCLLTSMEHRAREFFTYRGRAVFGPHFNVDMLWELARREEMDRREVKKESP